MAEPQEYDELSDWTFQVEEVSMGVYRARGGDRYGRGVDVKGSDPEALIEDCRRWARSVKRSVTSPRSSP